jgi:hypothetical protein
MVVEQVVELEAMRGGAIAQCGGRRCERLHLADDGAVATHSFRGHFAHDARPFHCEPNSTQPSASSRHHLAMSLLQADGADFEPLQKIDELPGERPGWQCFAFMRVAG